MDTDQEQNAEESEQFLKTSSALLLLPASPSEPDLKAQNSLYSTNRTDVKEEEGYRAMRACLPLRVRGVTSLGDTSPRWEGDTVGTKAFLKEGFRGG